MKMLLKTSINYCKNQEKIEYEKDKIISMYIGSIYDTNRLQPEGAGDSHTNRVYGI